MNNDIPGKSMQTSLDDLAEQAVIVVLHIRNRNNPASRALEGKLVRMMDEFREDPIRFVTLDWEGPGKGVLEKFPISEFPYMIFFLGGEVESTISGYHPDRVEREIHHLIDRAKLLGL